MVSLHELRQQWRERVTASVALFKGNNDQEKVGDELQKLGKTLWAKLKKQHDIMRFANKWGTRLMLTDSVADGARSGRPRKVTNVDAMCAAAILQNCMPANLVTMEDGSQHMEVTTEYFALMKQAYSLKEELQEICARCGVTPEALLTAAMAADKDLTRRTLGFKHGHTPASFQDRRDNSKQLDKQYQAAVRAAGGNRDALLDRVVCVAEATIYLANLDAKGLHVFCSKNDTSVRTVIQCPGLGKDKKIKIAAVSLKHGPLYFNFTTAHLGIKA